MVSLTTLWKLMYFMYLRNQT